MEPTTCCTDERWATIPGYDGCYEVSTCGRVKSLARIVLRRPGVYVPIQGGMLRDRSEQDPSRRPYVILCKERDRRHFLIHTLVLMAFVGPRPDGYQCCHNDGNAQDNHLRNLRWDTASGNMKDRVKHGTDPNRRKTHCPRGHAYDESNTSITYRGHRICKTCMSAYRREYHKTYKPNLANRTHGLPATYYSGCRCEPCRIGKREWLRERRKIIAACTNSDATP